MLSVDDAMALCRMFASWSGEPLLDQPDVSFAFSWGQLATAVERLLFELEVARADVEYYETQLKEWGIPAKKRMVKKIERKGFERGWNDEGRTNATAPKDTG